MLNGGRGKEEGLQKSRRTTLSFSLSFFIFAFHAAWRCDTKSKGTEETAKKRKGKRDREEKSVKGRTKTSRKERERGGKEEEKRRLVEKFLDGEFDLASDGGLTTTTGLVALFEFEPLFLDLDVFTFKGDETTAKEKGIIEGEFAKV